MTLQPLRRHGEKQSLQLSGSADSVLFTFNDILPGKYKGETFMPGCTEFFFLDVYEQQFIHYCQCCVFFAVNIVHEEWCWKNRSLELDVVDHDLTGTEFRQTGYMLRCALSHAITLVSGILYLSTSFLYYKVP